MPRASLKQRKDGRFCAKYKGQQFLGATQSEAYQKRDAYKKQIEAGLRTGASSPLLSAYASQWVFTYKSNVSNRTYSMYARNLNSLVSIIGDKPLREIYPIDIQRAYNQLVGKSQSHIKKYMQTVSALFASAVNNRYILSNPCVSATVPKGSDGSHRAIEQWERDLILRSDHRFTPAVLTMLYTGLRRGEVLALDIDRDVDFNAKTITVREAIRYDANAPILDNPKTKAGLRTIPMPDLLAKALRPLHGLVAPSAEGGIMSETAFTRVWESYLTHLEQLLNGGIKRWHGRRKEQDETWLKENPWRQASIRTHDLRHSYCTMLYDADVDVKTAQKWMGHSDLTTTMRIYTHLSAERETRSAESLNKFIEKQSGAGMQIGMLLPQHSSESIDI